MMVSRYARVATLVFGIAVGICLAFFSVIAVRNSAGFVRQIVGLKQTRATYEALVKRTRDVSLIIRQAAQAKSAEPQSANSGTWENAAKTLREWITIRRPGISPKTIHVYSGGSFDDDIGWLFDEVDRVLREEVSAAPAAVTGVADSRVAIQAADDLLTISGQVNSRIPQLDGYAHSVWKSFWWQLLLSVLFSSCAAWLGVMLHRLWASPLRTELRESRATIERQQKLAHFGELAAGLAHEIRNPLTAINARLFTLQKSLAPDSPESEDAAVINSEINRLDRIVKDFLKLARPADPQLVTLTARALIEEVVRLLSPELLKKHTELKVDSVVDRRFQGDPQQLKQVLINLVQNASDALGNGGTIRLSARSSSQKLHGWRREVVILEVTDNGPGIAPAMQLQLFDPFFSTKPEGTGLGLSISQRIAEKHGGTVEFSVSEPGRNTTFVLVLPAAGVAHET
jgi:signal transduction histidine kinase